MRKIMGMPRARAWLLLLTSGGGDLRGSLISLQTRGECMCMQCVIDTVDYGHDIVHYCNGYYTYTHIHTYTQMSPLGF